MFRRYLTCELVKQLKSKKNIALFCLLVIGLMVYFAYSYRMFDGDLERRIEFYDITAGELMQIDMQFGMDLTPSQAALRALARDERTRLTRARMYARHGMDIDHGFTLTGAQWREELGARILAYEAVLTGIYGFMNARIVEEHNIAELLGREPHEYALTGRFNDPGLPLRYRLQTEEELKATIVSLRYVYNTEMRPVFSEHDTTAWQFIYRVITIVAPLLVPIFAVFLCADILAGEKDSGSYKFLLLQPISRVKVYLGKVLSSYILCVCTLLGAFLLMFIFSGIAGGFGESGYPVRFGDLSAYGVINNENFTETMHILNPGTDMPAGFIAVSGFMLRALPLLLLSILFIVSLVTLISFIAENKLSAYSISLTVVLGSVIIQMFLPSESMVWNPLVYSDVNAIVAGGLLSFIWYLFAWTAALLAVGMLYFRKRDIIC